MPAIPEGAKTPTDRKPTQSDLIKPEAHADGWELLRPPMDVEYWEQADLLAAIAEVKTRGDRVELTAKNLKVVGQVARLLQNEFANDSSAFRAWVRGQGTFEDATTKLLPLAFEYAGALGEADSSAN